jgi:hypothetical protein
MVDAGSVHHQSDEASLVVTYMALDVRTGTGHLETKVKPGMKVVWKRGVG